MSQSQTNSQAIQQNIAVNSLAGYQQNSHHNESSQIPASQSNVQNVAASGGRPYSRGQTQSKMSTNQMAKIQHHEDGRKHNVTLLSQQIPYPSTGQYPNQQQNKYTFEDSRSGSMLANTQNQSSLSQNIQRDQNAQNMRSSSQNAAYPSSNQNFIQYTENIITGQNVNSSNPNKNQQKQYQNQISDLPYDNLKGQKAKDGSTSGQNTSNSAHGNHQPPGSGQQQFEQFERHMQNQSKSTMS